MIGRKTVAGGPLVAFLLLLILMTTGFACEGEEPEVVDEASLLALNSYVREMCLTLQDGTLRADLKGWVREYYEDDLPLYYDEERREWLGEHLGRLEEVYTSHRRAASFPSDEEIASWSVYLVQGETEWLLEGTEALAALGRLDDLYGEMTAVASMIIDNDGELDLSQSERVLALLESLDSEIEAVRSFFFRG